MAPAKKTLLWVVGALLVLAVAALLGGIWWLSSLHQSGQTDIARAAATFAEVRGRLPGLTPPTGSTS